MESVYVEQKTFEKADFSIVPLPKGEYEYCTFINCNFSDGKLNGINFTECEFRDCNISNAQLGKTVFNNVRFVGCKLLGLHFYDCSDLLFSAGFQNCILNFSSFFKVKLKNTIFSNCEIQEADFTQADLGGATFADCNLLKAMFDRTNLEKADLRTASNYSINPELNKIKKAKFSVQGLPGLLGQYGIVVE
jgi:uncharacterized protein YjbI with pentapeptide repeats